MQHAEQGCACRAGVPVRSGRDAGHGRGGSWKAPGLEPRAQLQRQTGGGSRAAAGHNGQGRGSESRPFMDMEAAGGLFQHSFQKTEREGASSLRSTQHGVLEGWLRNKGAQLHRQRLRGTGWECAQGTPWLGEGRVGPKLSSSSQPPRPHGARASPGQGLVETGTSTP